MIASVYIKDGNLHLYNEKDSLSSLGGIIYILGRPLLDFVCYEPEQFDEAFTTMAEAFDNEFAHEVVNTPAFTEVIKESMSEMQARELYVSFYSHIFYNFVRTFVDSPSAAVEELIRQIPNLEKDITDRLSWAMDFKYPKSSPLVTVAYFSDKEKRLFRAAKDIVKIMGDDIRKRIDATIFEIEFLLHTRSVTEHSDSPLHYLYLMEVARSNNRRKNNKEDGSFFIEKKFKTFYGMVKEEIVQLYEIDSLNDLFRFELIKMIEHDVFIKKCKNCGRYFLPKRRADAEYCERIFTDSGKKCSEVGASIQHDKKVSENPVWEAYKKAYRRFNSRTRMKKMTQGEFLNWSDEAGRKRDACLAGELPFNEYIAWLEQGRVRRARSKPPKNEKND